MADRSSEFAPTPTGLVIRSVLLDVSGGDQTPTDVPNGFHCNTAGNITGRLQGDSADGVFAVLAGVVYGHRFLVVRQTGTTAAGRFLYTV